MKQCFVMYIGSNKCDCSQGNYTKTQVSLACNYRKLYLKGHKAY